MLILFKQFVLFYDSSFGRICQECVCIPHVFLCTFMQKVYIKAFSCKMDDITRFSALHQQLNF